MRPVAVQATMFILQPTESTKMFLETYDNNYINLSFVKKIEAQAGEFGSKRYVFFDAQGDTIETVLTAGDGKLENRLYDTLQKLCYLP